MFINFQCVILAICLQVPSTPNGNFGLPPNISPWEIGQKYAGQQSKGGMGVGSPMNGADGAEMQHVDPCRADMNSPILPDCLLKYIKNGVVSKLICLRDTIVDCHILFFMFQLIDGNSHKCGNKAVLPAKLDVNVRFITKNCFIDKVNIAPNKYRIY